MSYKIRKFSGSPACCTLLIAQCKALAADWSYDTVVQPIARPEWMERVVMICDSPWADREKGILKPQFRLLKDAGFSVLNMYPDGFCRLYAPAAGDDWPRECHAETKAMHTAGMFVLAGCYPTVGERGPRDLLEQHPEWRLRKEEKVPESPGLGCLISPFGAALIDLLVSRIKEYDIDGYQFDGWYQFEYCCCPGCKQQYRQESGFELPAKADRADLAYLKYLTWRNGKLLQRYVQLQAAVKAAKSTVVMVQWNNNDCAGAYPSGMPESLNCVSDWVNKEWWDAADTTSTWLIKRLRGSSGDRPVGMQPYMFMRWGYDIESGVYHGSSCPMPEVLYRMHKAMALGSIPIIWPGARAGWKEADAMKVSQDLVDFLPYIHQTKSLKYVACIDSFTTLQALKTTKAEEIDERVAYPRGGITRALIEEHIPFDVLSEHNLTGEVLAQYKVIILPNNRCVPARVASLLREYVSSGGSLVATFETSLFNPVGEKRPDFDLAELLGAHYLSTSTAGPSRVAYAAPKHPVVDDPVLRDLTGDAGNTTYYGKFARVKTAPGAIAPLIGLDMKHEKDPSLRNWTPLLLSEHGKGRVAYFPAAIDAAYFDAGYPYKRTLLRNAVQWAAGAPPLIRIGAPKCVLANFLTQEDAGSRKVIVHLLNDLNSTSGHGSRNDNQFAFREEIVPLTGVTITFPGDKPVRVRLVPGQQELEPASCETGWRITVPSLGLHAVVCT